ncbi:MAG TPA: STN domain-containing protein [Gemmataceae bacterium]|nr:STN domain-containing protein [Gemmataceae bacterium]
MPATTRPLFNALLLTLCAVVLLLGGPTRARADDILDKQRRDNVIRTQELKFKMSGLLADAKEEARKSPTKAVEMLRQLRVEVEDANYLSDTDRKGLLRQLDGEIATYRDRGRLIGRPGNDKDDVKAAAKDRQQQIKEEEERKAELEKLFRQKSRLLQEGRYDEVDKMGEEVRRKYGNSPFSESFRTISSARSSLRAMEDLKNQRNQRYAELQRDLARKMLPIVGDVEFPPRDKWLALTKRRTQIKLTDDEKKILKILNTKITTNVKEKPLSGVLEYFEKTLGLPMSIDRPSLEAAQINYETMVSLDVRETTVRTALKQMLASVGLTYVIRNEMVIITTPEKASTMMVTRVYYIGDLLATTGFQFDPFATQLQLMQNIAGLIAYIQSIEPTTWREGGGQGTIGFDPIRLALIVKQSAEMQFVLQGALR